MPDEEKAVVSYRSLHKEVGYRKLTWMMIDQDIAALSESAVYKILKQNNLLFPWKNNKDEAGKEYKDKPQYVHHHWHIDISYIKISGIFYFLIIMLDGFSRYILGWELMTDMLSSSVQNFVQSVREKYPNCSPILINDNGSQFIARDFKRLLSQLEIQQTFTRRNHPQTNGKIERLNGTIKNEAIRIASPTSFAEAYSCILEFVLFYNNSRLHAGIHFLRPNDIFTGIHKEILDKRKNKIIAARSARIAANSLLLKA